MKALYDLIRQFEGCCLKPYLCPAGIPTVGYGHTGPDVRLNSPPISQAFAEQLLEEDAAYFIQQVGKLSPVLLLNPDKHAAIADFCFNLGVGRYKASTLKRKVDAQEWEEAGDELRKWVFGGGRRLPGLVTRREAERALLLK